MIRRRKIHTQEEILKLLEASDSECSGLSGEEDIDDISYEPPINEGESSSDKQYENISVQKTTLDIACPSTSKLSETPPQNIVLKSLQTSIKKKKKQMHKYNWVDEKFNPVPHPGHVDFSQLQILDDVTTPLQYFQQYFSKMLLTLLISIPSLSQENP